MPLKLDRICFRPFHEKVESRFDLVLKASERARDLISTSAEPLVEPENDKPTIIALREIAAGVLDEDYVSPSDTEEVFLEKLLQCH